MSFRQQDGLGISCNARTRLYSSNKQPSDEGIPSLSIWASGVKEHNKPQEEIMKTKAVAEVVAVAFIILAGALVAFLPAQEAQPANNPNFQLVPPDQMPVSGTFYSSQRQWMPPWPYDPWPELPLYDLGGGYYLVDDREVDYDALAQLNRLLTLEGGEGGAQMQAAGTPADYGCALFMDITPNGSNAVVVGLHNTRAGQEYAIESTENLGSPSIWTTATNVTASGDSIEVLIGVEHGKHKFFRASDDWDYVVITNFSGLGYTNTVVDPPDTMGAVGPNHFVELLNGFSTNSAVVVYDKSGNVVAETNVIDFFRIGTNYPKANSMFDPRILYDKESGRWVATSFDVGSSNVILAVSSTNSPTNLVADWTRYLLSVNQPNMVTDFPTLGLDGNGLYVSVLQFQSGTNSGHTILAIKKPEIYDGTFIAQKFEITNSPLVWIIQPVVNFDPVGTSDFAWFVAKGPPDLGTNYQGGTLLYRRLQWSGTNAFLDTNWFTLAMTNTAYRDYYDLDGTNISILPSFANGMAVFAPQTNGTPINLHPVGSRLSATIIRNGFLWTCQAIGLKWTNGTYVGNQFATNVDRTGAQWLRAKLDESGGLSYSAHGRVYDQRTSNPSFYYFPSLMVNCAGDMVMGFSGSSATNYIGAYYTWRLSDGTTVNSPRLIQAGLTNYTTDLRWGDFSATSLDPVDDWSFWTIQEYADPTGVGDSGTYPWKTVIANIKPAH